MLAFRNKYCTFAATVPATPLLESVPRQDFVFYKGRMQYTKQAMDFCCQLSILKERGLTIENEEEALNFLHSVSYFALCELLAAYGAKCRITPVRAEQQFFFC